MLFLFTVGCFSLSPSHHIPAAHFWLWVVNLSDIFHQMRHSRFEKSDTKPGSCTLGSLFFCCFFFFFCKWKCSPGGGGGGDDTFVCTTSRDLVRHELNVSCVVADSRSLVPVAIPPKCWYSWRSCLKSPAASSRRFIEGASVWAALFSTSLFLWQELAGKCKLGLSVSKVVQNNDQTSAGKQPVHIDRRDPGALHVHFQFDIPHN